jgi:hypothetical protein
MRFKLESLLLEIESREGTTFAGAVRDLLTDLAHLCAERGVDVEERLRAALEVAAEEEG